jgi:para-nitrobenzyl esterase
MGRRFEAWRGRRLSATSCALAMVVIVASARGAQPAADVRTPPRVETQAGVVEGEHQRTIDLYLGVPYARPPVGALRWRAPQPLESWQGARPTKAFAASCYQPWPAPHFGPYTSEYVDTPQPSEDCLYLNVWTPAARGTAKHPVLVWVHGGGFLGGSGAVPIYDGADLARQGVVVVTINYRVGPFGFLAHRELTAEAKGGPIGNFGLQDVVAALRWVHDNIASFGGDPQAVTVAGQSAGALAVNDLLVSPYARGLFQRAIAQSGSGMGIDAKPRADAERDGDLFATQLGVKGLAALRALPADQVQAAVVMPFVPRPDGAPPPILFRPQVDGVFLPVDPVDGRAPATSTVPTMTGFNADEFMPPGPQSRVDFERLVRTRFGARSDPILALYPHATDAQADASAHVLQRDVYLTSLALWAGRRAQQPGQRIYAYCFEHPSPVAAGPSFGTFHTSEIPYVFGMLDRNARPYTAADERISKQLQGYWLAFIRTGDPNGKGRAAWAPVSPAGTSIMGIGDHPGPRAPASSPPRFKALQEFVASGGRLSMM